MKLRRSGISERDSLIPDRLPVYAEKKRESGVLDMTGALELPRSNSDGDLVRAAAEGDRQAFAEIYDRYADRLYDFCVGLLGDRDAAADCVQDAFCVAATDLGGLREPDKLRPWL